MKLNKIKGNSYYIDAPTNTGVYLFKNKNCILIDTGLNKSHSKKLDKVLIENGVHPKYIINTHSHLDHCGGNIYFQENYPGCQVYTSSMEKSFMEYPHLQSTILFSSTPIKMLNDNNKKLNVDFILDYGINKINNEKFNIVSLKGHSFEQIGVITPEKVCYIGDSIFSDEILDKYSFPYLNDIDEELKTLESLKQINGDYFVISHSSKVLNKDELLKLIDKNINNINNYLEQFMELLEQPLTREDILENISILNELDMDFKHYYINLSSISSFLTYLCQKNLIEYSIENGKLYYFIKK